MRTIYKLPQILCALAISFFAGCGQQQTVQNVNQNLPWSSRLNASKSNILYGTWETAESSWAMLKHEGRSASNLDQWIDFQVEILNLTQSDSGRYSVKIGAIQEMDFYPESAMRYRDWLKSNIQNGFFQDQRVLEKAALLLDNLN